MKDPIAIDAYQGRTVAAADAVLAGSGREGVLIVAPTGAGKTRMTLRILAMEMARGGRAVVMHEQRGLAEQSAEVARKEGFDAKAWFSGSDGDPAGGQVVYTTVDAVAANAARFGRVTIHAIDEVHHASDEPGGHYDRAIAGIEAANPGSRMLSTTATDERPDGRGLHRNVARSQRLQVTWKEAYEAGMIVQARTVVRPRHLANGTTLQAEARRIADPRRPEDSQKGLNGILKRHRRAEDIDAIAADFVIDTLREQRREGADPKAARRPEKTLVFTDAIADADAMAEALASRGVTCLALHSKMPRARQDEARAAYAAGTIEALVSVDALGEGFDSPDTVRILNAKATTSRLEYVQMANRVTRANEGKTHGRIHDYGASTMLHGSSEVHAAIEAYLTPAPAGTGRAPLPGNEFRSDWTAWNAVAGSDGVHGLDLGDRQLFCARAHGSARVVVEVAPGKDRVTITRRTLADGAALKALTRAAIGASKPTVASLSSDIGQDGRSEMARRVEAAYARHRDSIDLHVVAARAATKAPCAKARGRALA